MSLVTLRDVSISHGGPPLLEGVDVSIGPGERIGLVGRNGAGKTTLLRVVRGALEPAAGAVTRAPGVRVAEMAQRLEPDLAGTVFDVVAGGLAEGGALLARYHRLAHALGDGATPARLAELDRVQREVERAGGFTLEPKVAAAIDRIGLDPDADVARLSVGIKRRVLLARAIASEPDLLILDEPTNHLDLAGIEWIEAFLQRFPGALLCVTHDREFLRRLATRFLLVDRGRVRTYACGYDDFVRRRDADLEVEERAAAEQDRRLAREEEWARQGVKARRTKAAARERALEELRAARRARPRAVGTARVETARVERSGDLVAELTGVSFAYGDGPPIVADLTTTVLRGDKIGVMGPNGAGKTTLLRLILGELAPTRGTVRRGVKLEVGVFDQLHRELDDDRTVAGNVTESDFVELGDGRRRHVVGYLQGFLFTRDQIHAPVRHLSGGERNRVLLARLFARPSNLLVLDEPTNDLDVETIEVLEERLVRHPGTVLLVSHDREFLNRVVTSTLVLEGGGRVGEYAGGYDDWLRQRPAPEHAAPASAARAARKAPVPAKAKPKSGTRMLSRAEREELAALPERIEALEAERVAVHERMADPAFYAGGASDLAAASARLKELDAALELAYGRWEELEPHV